MRLNFKSLPELLAFIIKYYRYLNGYSQEKLAELCKLSPRYLTDIERGIHCPPISRLEFNSWVREKNCPFLGNCN